MRLSGNSCLVDGCGALRLGGVGVKWELRAWKGGCELGGSCLWGGVDGAASLSDMRGGGVDPGQYCTLNDLSIAAMDIGRLRMSRESVLFFPNLLRS